MLSRLTASYCIPIHRSIGAASVLPGESPRFAKVERQRAVEGEHTLNPAIVMPITGAYPTVGYS